MDGINYQAVNYETTNQNENQRSGRNPGRSARQMPHPARRRGISTTQYNQLHGIQKKEDNKDEEKIQAKQNSGQPAMAKSGPSGSTTLPASMHGPVAQQYGLDASSVNIHPESEQAPAMNALAFTQGNAIHFAPGQYSPETKSGKELIGHELTHVVQQQQGRVGTSNNKQAKSNLINDDAGLEKEADQQGSQFANAAVQKKEAEGAPISMLAPSQGKTVQRQTDQEQLDAIAPQQAIYEFAAHHLAYKAEGSALTAEEFDVLESAGYAPDRISWFGKSGGAKLGFQAVLIPSASNQKHDIIAVRGTIPGGGSENLMTVYVDMDPRAVGLQQFEANLGLIRNIFGMVAGKADVTGHSLGGAMAQHIAVNFADRVANVATFQSPGIDLASVDRFNQMPEDNRPKSVHHIVTGDIVDKAGEASLPGEVYEHNFGRQLDVNVMLRTLSNDIGGIKGDFGQFNHELFEINRTVLSQLNLFKMPSTRMREIAEISARINTLGNLKDDISQRVTHVRDYVKQVGAGVGDAHATRVFSSAHYATMRADLGTSEVDMGTANRQSTVSRTEVYPHQDQRETAEPIRQNLGGKLQGVLKAYILIVKAYEEVVHRFQQLKQGVTAAWDGFKEKAEGMMHGARERIHRAWEAIKSIF